MAARWAQAGREAPPRPPARPMNAPELTSALSVQVLPSQPTMLSTSWSCKCPTRRMGMPSGSRQTPKWRPQRAGRAAQFKVASRSRRASCAAATCNTWSLAATLWLGARRDDAQRALEHAGHAAAAVACSSLRLLTTGG